MQRPPPILKRTDTRCPDTTLFRSGLRGVGADQDPARARTAGAGGMNAPTAPRLLLVTGLSGAGKSTVLRVLEDLGWEVVDNLPLSLLEPLIEAPVHRSEANRPLAVGIDSRSRGFRPALLVQRLKQLRAAGDRKS